MKKAKPILKAFLSLWVVFNIAVIVVMPNVSSYFGRLSSRFLAPYANIVGLNAGWNFFSPDPAHTMYIHYMVYFANPDPLSEADEKEPFEGFFPMEKNKGIGPMTRQRELYVMRFMVINRTHMKYLLGPWLCRQHPGASSVDMEPVIETVAPLDQAVMQRNESMEDLSHEMQFVAERFNCRGASDEVEL